MASYNSFIPTPPFSLINGAVSTVLHPAEELSTREKLYLEHIIQRLEPHDDDDEQGNEVDEIVADPGKVDDDKVDISEKEREEDEEEVGEEQEEELEEDEEVDEEEEEKDDDAPDINVILSNSCDVNSQPSKKSGTNPSKRKACSICRNVAPGKKARSASKVTIVQRVEPAMPPKDCSEYRVIKLSNGLTAALIRKPENPQNCQKTAPATLMDFIQMDLEKQTIFLKQNHWPVKYIQSFPLVNLRMAEGIINIIQNELIDVNNNNATNDNTNDDEESSKNNNGAVDKNLQSTLAVMVNVGITDDPEDCHGLAHFAEHMMHYGSRKYPEEDGYDSFVSLCGSEFNAFTLNHSTGYYNSVPSDYLGKSMDMVADMLTFPLFHQDMVNREVNAVDSEFHLKRHYDILRRYFLFNYAVEDHPMGNFGFGNADSLLETKDIKKSLVKFHSKYYVASAMTLGLESVLPLATQERMILDYFSDLPQGNRKTTRETKPSAKEKRIVGKSFNMDYIIQGLCAFSNFWVAWSIPEEFVKQTGNKSMSVLLQMLGDEKEGGLAHFLTNKQYIWLMLCMAPAMLLENKYTTFVSIDFFLTKEGEANIPDIMNATLSFLTQLMTKVPDLHIVNVFNEVKRKTERNFDYGALGNPQTSSISAMSLAETLQTVEHPKDMLKGEAWTWKEAKFSVPEVRSILKHMNSSNMIVIQTLPISTKIRQYTKGKVWLAPYTEAEFVMQSLGKRFPKKSSRSNYNFPLLNPQQTLIAGLTVLLHPQNYGEIRKQDLKLKSVWGNKVIKAIHFGSKPGVYQSACLINYLNARVTSNAKNFAMSLLWTTSVTLNFLNVMSEEPGSYITLIPHDYGIAIIVVGYPDKMLDFVEKTNEQFFAKPVSETGFKRAKAALITMYDVLLASNVGFITQELLHFMNCNHSGDVLSDALVHIENSSRAELNYFCEAFKTDTMALVVVDGNMSVQSAHQVVDIVNKHGGKYTSYFTLAKLYLSNKFKSQAHSSYANSLTTGEKCMRLKSDRGLSYTTSVVNLYYVGVYDPVKYKLWWNSLYFFELRAFLYLRTIKQLGYAVGAFFPKPQANQPMVLGVYVISTGKRFTPCELDIHLDQFMIEYGIYLRTIPEKSFECLKASRGHIIQEPKVTLAEATTWYQSYFGTTFGSNDDPNKFHKLGMFKLSIQILGNELKACACEKCNNIAGWQKCQFWNNFQFARGKGPREKYFVTDPKKIRG